MHHNNNVNTGPHQGMPEVSILIWSMCSKCNESVYNYVRVYVTLFQISRIERPAHNTLSDNLSVTEGGPEGI